LALLLIILSGCASRTEEEPVLTEPVATLVAKPAPLEADETAVPTPQDEQTEVTPMVEPGSPPTVRIENRQLTDQDLADLIEEGLFQEDVAEVIMPGNALTADGVQMILSSPVTHLQVLNLYNNQIGDEGAHLLSNSEKVAGVNRLLLGVNGITTTGIEALFGNASLIVGPTWIDVSGNDVGDDGLAIILARPNLEYLEGLSVRRGGLTDDAAQAIVDVARQLANLQYLDLGGNDLSAAAQELLQKNPYLQNTQKVFD
jgi:Ran GTPase-activating protein (RanGAP) involved in mRNA processing and transport